MASRKNENLCDLEMKCEEYINSNLSHIPGQKVTIVQLQEDFMEWSKDDFEKENFKIQFTDILTKILSIRPTI
jgi:uncharacterized protein YutD